MKQIKIKNYLLFISLCLSSNNMLNTKDTTSWYTTFMTWYQNYLATRTPEEQAYKGGFLLQPNILSNIKNRQRHNLFIAIIKNQPIQHYLQQYRDNAVPIDCKLPDGTSPVTLAIMLQKKEKVRQLIQQGFTITKQDFYKAEFLLNDPHKQLCEQDAAYLAFLYDHIQEKHHEFIKPAFFDEQQKRAPETTPEGTWTHEYLLSKAAQQNNVEKIKELILLYDVNPNESVNCIDPLEMAVVHQNLDAMNILIELGAKPTAKHIQQALVRKELLMICHEESRRIRGDKYPGPTGNIMTDMRLYGYIAQRLSTIQKRQSKEKDQQATEQSPALALEKRTLTNSTAYRSMRKENDDDSDDEPVIVEPARRYSTNTVEF